jgi:integrase
MTGHIERRKNGWKITISAGTDELGKRQRIYETVKGSKSEARRRLTDLQRQIDTGRFVPRGPRTFGQFVNDWLPNKRHAIRPSTAASYERLLNGYILPALCDRPIQKITSSEVGRIITTQADRGKLSTAEHLFRLMRVVFRSAMQQQEIGRDPTVGVDRPKAKRRELSVLTPSEWRRVSAYVEQRYPHFLTPLTLLITTGLRRSELCGLQWGDIDFDRRVLSVNRGFHVVKGKGGVHTDPKTDRSRRVVALDAIALELLRVQFDNVSTVRSSLDLKTTMETPVFSLDQISPLRPDTISQLWLKVKKALGLNVRLHDLRHTAATLMLAAGVPIGDVSDRLGHATPGFTMTVYRHAIPGAQEEAAERLAALLHGDAYVSDGNKLSPGLSPQRKLAAIS